MTEEQIPGPDHRVFRRTSLSTNVEIEVEGPEETGATDRRLFGQIIDVGVGGILACLSEGLAEGTLCTVRFTDKEVGDLEARGYVRRLRTDKSDFLVGIEFEARLDALRTPSLEEQLEGFDLEATRILVVDDEPSVVELLYRFLSSRGCNVSTASNGQEAINMLRVGRQDITVLDLKMPGMGGLEVLETIREENLDAGKIWAVSGYATDDEAREALAQGATDFISKPLDLKYLEWSMQLHRAVV